MRTPGATVVGIGMVLLSFLVGAADLFAGEAPGVAHFVDPPAPADPAPGPPAADRAPVPADPGDPAPVPPEPASPGEAGGSEVSVGEPEPGQLEPKPVQPVPRAAFDPTPKGPRQVVVHDINVRPDERITTWLGHDFTYARGGAGAAPLGNIELGVATEGYPVGYISFRSIILGWGGTMALRALDVDSDRGLSLACWMCFSVGWRVYKIEDQATDLEIADEDAPPARSYGWLTAGIHLEDTFVGTDFDFLSIGVGGDIGYMTGAVRGFSTSKAASAR